MPEKGDKNNIYKRYTAEVVPQMMEQFSYGSKMEVPRLSRIMVNIGIGKWIDNREVKDKMMRDLANLSGQRPVSSKAKKAIAGFKIRAGQAVGLVVTLRGPRMYDFFERLVVAALPRVRDFRGIPEANFNNKGDVSVGIKEHTVFAEIDSENVDHIFGLQVNIVTTAKSKEEGIALLKHLGFPIRSAKEDAGVIERIKSKREEAKEKEAKAKKKEKKA